MDPPSTPERNEVWISACTFITFGLSAEFSEAYAVGTIYYLS